jgi:GntR family transcriptional regulator
MDIIISNKTNAPIYEQIKEQIKTQIVSGELKEGDALPSMRLLAKELKISVITTKRAYEDLENEGYIESYMGKGSFVCGINSNTIKEQMIYEVQVILEEVITKANVAGISQKELIEMVQMLYE